MTHRASFDKGRSIALILFSCGLMQTGWASEITVQVSKRRAGDPVRAAAVCLGTPANLAQFGARLADDQGKVQFDKVHTRAELLLTVSKSGYKGRQVVLGNDSRNRGVLLTLASGGGGPACEKAVAFAGQAPILTSPSAHFRPGIAEFRINGGEPSTRSAAVKLDYVLTGEASHYRASDRSDFRAAQWRPLEPDLHHQLAGDAGLKTIYFQVGKFTSTEGAEIEILSNVAVDTIEFKGG